MPLLLVAMPLLLVAMPLLLVAYMCFLSFGFVYLGPKQSFFKCPSCSLDVAGSAGEGVLAEFPGEVSLMYGAETISKSDISKAPKRRKCRLVLWETTGKVRKKITK